MKMGILRLLPDKLVKMFYVNAGADFGDAVSYLYMGECISFEKLLDNWAACEKEYAIRGYRTISLDDFVELGGYGEPKKHLIGIKRKSNEKAVFHAGIYRQKFLGRVPKAVHLKKMEKDGKQQFGEYVLPSTKMFREKK